MKGESSLDTQSARNIMKDVITMVNQKTNSAINESLINMQNNTIALNISAIYKRKTNRCLQHIQILFKKYSDYI